MPRGSADKAVKQFNRKIGDKKIAIKQTRDGKLKERLQRELEILLQQKAHYVQNQHPER